MLFLHVFFRDEFSRVIKESTNLPQALTISGDTPSANDIVSYETDYYYDDYYNRIIK